MHKEYGGVITVSFFICFGDFLVDVYDFRFREVLENVLGVLFPKGDSLGVQITSQNGGVVGIVNHPDDFEPVLVGEQFQAVSGMQKDMAWCVELVPVLFVLVERDVGVHRERHFYGAALGQESL